jgi:hypothetical protein
VDGPTLRQKAVGMPGGARARVRPRSPSAAPACARVFTLARLGHTAKTRHQKRPAETGGRNGASIAKFRTRRPAHICETSRYRPVFERPSYLTRLRRTGWLGRADSNLCISESEFAKTLSLGGGIRTSAYRNHLNGGFGPSVGRLRLFSSRSASFEMR